jgi:UDP-N-acetylmuramate--alanine ligase
VELRPLGVSATVMRRDRRVHRPTLQEQLDSWDAPKDTDRGTADDGSIASRPLVALGTLTLNVPGQHNLLNALAAVAVGGELGLSFDRIAAGLAEFQGAERRFELRGEPRGILLVDDYGHHPTEIAAVLAAAKTLNRRIVVAFQPHRYTRTASLMDAFGPALAGADHIVLTDIYGAGEDRIPGVTVDALADAVRRSVTAPVEVVASLDQVVPAIVRIARSGDLVITLGAGSIGTLPDQLIAALGGRA